MIAVIQFTTLILATLLAAAAAVVCNWLLLRAAFHLMRPAAQRQTSVRTEIAPGTMQLVRALAPHR